MFARIHKHTHIRTPHATDTSVCIMKSDLVTFIIDSHHELHERSHACTPIHTHARASVQTNPLQRIYSSTLTHFHEHIYVYHQYAHYHNDLSILPRNYWQQKRINHSDSIISFLQFNAFDVARADHRVWNVVREFNCARAWKRKFDASTHLAHTQPFMPCPIYTLLTFSWRVPSTKLSLLKRAGLKP